MDRPTPGARLRSGLARDAGCLQGPDFIHMRTGAQEGGPRRLTRTLFDVTQDVLVARKPLNQEHALSRGVGLGRTLKGILG